MTRVWLYNCPLKKINLITATVNNNHHSSLFIFETHSFGASLTLYQNQENPFSKSSNLFLSSLISLISAFSCFFTVLQHHENAPYLGCFVFGCSLHSALLSLRFFNTKSIKVKKEAQRRGRYWSNPNSLSKWNWGLQCSDF